MRVYKLYLLTYWKKASDWTSFNWITRKPSIQGPPETVTEIEGIETGRYADKVDWEIFVGKTDASLCKWQFLQLDRCNQRSPTGICVRTTVILDICQRLVRLG